VVEVVQAFANVATVLALLWAAWSFRHELRFTHYAELDRLYLELVAMRVHTPACRAPPPDPPVNADEREAAAKYDAYALLMWNFIETIHDRCEARRLQFSLSRDLVEIWWPVIQAEGTTHATWLGANRRWHKHGFRKWAYENIEAVPESALGAPFAADERRRRRDSTDALARQMAAARSGGGPPAAPAAGRDAGRLTEEGKDGGAGQAPDGG
jgi:hypothetical protein